MSHRITALILLLSAGCGGKDDESVKPSPDTDVGDTDTDIAEDLCGNAGAALPEGLLELSHDDGEASGNLEDQGWSVTTTQTYNLGEEKSWESVRFELEAPARVHGFSVMWSQLPEDPEKKLTVGLHPDFGYNGFDFWAPDPYATGRRCAGDVVDGEWTTYTLEEPVDIDVPGLVYVAHDRKGAGSPSWMLDSSQNGDGACGGFDDCRSAVNMPEADAGSYYNGLSLMISVDYLVRLHLEYTDEVSPADPVFERIDDAPAGYRTAWGDYDDDGDEDVLAGGANLYENDGGTFTNVTDAAGLTGIGGSGAVWGDYDNDGCLDFFVFNESYSTGDLLLHSNCDGTFSEVGVLAGIDDVQDYNLCEDNPANVHAPSSAAAWLDIDGDGFLDLYIVNFNCWDDYSHYTDNVWHNEGNGTFTEWTGLNGFETSKLAGRGASPVDHDGDGDVDLLVNSYVLLRNAFYENNGDGSVTEKGRDIGLAGIPVQVGLNPYYGHTIGAAWGDLDNDGDFDSVQANLAHPRYYNFSDKTQILLNDGGEYADNAGDWAFPASDAGLRYQETHSVPVLADFDQDGVLDLSISAVYNGRPTDFYWGVGDGSFVLDSYHAGIDSEDGWGMSAADIDGDGDLDLAVKDGMFENVSATGHWFQVRAVGNVASNWAALGATIRVTAGSDTWIRHVQGGSGQGCQDPQTQHFGIGSATTIDAIEIDFPGGGTVTYDGPFDADQRLRAFEDGTTGPL